MKSGVLLLLLAALLSARLRRGSAEGEPLPAELIDLLRTAPIASVDQLRVLLQENNATDEDEHDVPSNRTQARRPRSLVDVQPAQQAACKVRTEVTEISRSMLDRRNANFLLWPPCVEVQRCSGCCNARTMQCIPTLTATRYLQVIKIQYINKKAHYDKAVVSVDDHISCRCQPSSSSSASIPVAPPPLPRAGSPSSSKAELHRHDDLKHNQQQRRGSEEGGARAWPPGGYAQLLHWTPHRAPVSVRQTSSSLAPPPRSWPSEAGAELGVTETVRGAGHGSGYDGSKEEGPLHHRQEEEPGQWHGPTRQSPPLHPSTPKKDSAPQVTHHKESEDSGSANQGTVKDSGGGGAYLSEEEPREKLLEVLQRETKPRPLLPSSTSLKTGFPTAHPASPPPVHVLLRPAAARRRRKHRKRISKAALRAMILQR